MYNACLSIGPQGKIDLGTYTKAVKSFVSNYGAATKLIINDHLSNDYCSYSILYRYRYTIKYLHIKYNIIKNNNS